MEGLGQQPGDTYVTEKNTYDAFQNTGLDGQLRRWGVDTVIVGGVVTNLCCDTTARCVDPAGTSLPCCCATKDTTPLCKPPKGPPYSQSLCCLVSASDAVLPSAPPSPSGLVPGSATPHDASTCEVVCWHLMRVA